MIGLDANANSSAMASHAGCEPLRRMYQSGKGIHADCRPADLVPRLLRVASIGEERPASACERQHPGAAGKSTEITDVGQVSNQKAVDALVFELVLKTLESVCRVASLHCVQFYRRGFNELGSKLLQREIQSRCVAGGNGHALRLAGMAGSGNRDAVGTNRDPARTVGSSGAGFRIRCGADG